MTSWENRTDEELVSLAQGGSEPAFDELVNRHTVMVYRVAYGITGIPQEAEEVVQETFLKAFKYLDRFSPAKASFRTWLLTIARNQSINVFSSLKRKATKFFADFESDESSRQSVENHFAVDRENPETLLMAKREIVRLQEALKKLPERQRTALLLKTQEDLSYDEIAEILKSSGSAVESLIFRARRRLIEIMEE